MVKKQYFEKPSKKCFQFVKALYAEYTSSQPSSTVFFMQYLQGGNGYEITEKTKSAKITETKFIEGY